MARPKSPEGKRITICVKVSESDAAAIDAARGGLTRSAWGRDLMLGALDIDRPSQARPVRQRRDVAASPSSLPVSPGPAPAAQREHEKCSHPKARVLKGKCWACGELIGKR